jgi:hypothetical protein
MREELAQREGRRGRFTATFVRFGKKRGFDGRPPVATALFVDVRDERGQLVTDHLWFTLGLILQRLELRAGEQIEFEARVTEYYKGYVSGRYDDDNWQVPEKDYRLSWPTRARKVTGSGPQELFEELPLFKGVEGFKVPQVSKP